MINRSLVDLWENGQASLGPGTISSRTRNMSVGFKYIFLNILHFVCVFFVFFLLLISKYESFIS